MKEAMGGKKDKKMSTIYYDNLNMKDYVEDRKPLHGQGHLGGEEPHAPGGRQLPGAHEVRGHGDGGARRVPWR